MWLMVIIFLMFFFELHSRAFELIQSLPSLAHSLSPKFYVALTGTSSFLSGKVIHFIFIKILSDNLHEFNKNLPHVYLVKYCK